VILPSRESTEEYSKIWKISARAWKAPNPNPNPNEQPMVLMTDTALLETKSILTTTTT
jgi:hypothetical protein